MFPNKLVYCIKNRDDSYPVTLYRPYDVDFIKDNIVVVEGFYPYSRIQIFNNKGKPLKIVAEGDIIPFGVTVSKDSSDVIAITDHKDRTVKTYSVNSGQLIYSWPEGTFDWPNGIATDKFGNYVVTDWSKGELSIHEPDGTPCLRFPTNSKQSYEQTCPEYVTIDERGRIILTDTYKRIVKVFDPTGSLLLSFGNENTENSIIDPRGVSLNLDGNILIADWGGHRISEYSPDGRFIQHVLNQENDDINNPWGIRCHPEHAKMVLTEQKLNAKPFIKLYKKTD